MANKIYVGNIPYNIFEIELEPYFQKFGVIDDIRVITDNRSGRSRGFGFITFSTDESAKAALGMDGEFIDNRRIYVKYAHDQQGAEIDEDDGDNIGNRIDTPIRENTYADSYVSQERVLADETTQL